MTARLEKISTGHYILRGQLNFNSVPQLWSANSDLLWADTAANLEIDLLQLERSDSSGLALLIEWYREAGQQQKKIVFVNLPVQMYEIARISGLDEILPLSHR